MAYSTTPECWTSRRAFWSASAVWLYVYHRAGGYAKLLPEEWRTFAFGVGIAAGSFGQFLYSPLAVALIGAVGWQNTLVTFGALMLLVLPMALVVSTPPAGRTSGTGAPRRSRSGRRSPKHSAQRSYVLLVLGFFTCGFQLAFITVHLPAYLVDRGLERTGRRLDDRLIGLFNIIGSLSSGWLAGRMPKRYLLSLIYFAAPLALLAFISFPAHRTTSIVFGDRDGAVVAVDRAADLRAGRAHVRYALARDAHRLRVLQPPGRRFLGVWLGGLPMSGPAPTTWCGGWRSCSACSRR